MIYLRNDGTPDFEPRKRTIVRTPADDAIALTRAATELQQLADETASPGYAAKMQFLADYLRELAAAIPVPR